MNQVLQWVENLAFILARGDSLGRPCRGLGPCMAGNVREPQAVLLRVGLQWGSDVEKRWSVLQLLVSATRASAASNSTDFGIRTVGVRTTSGRVTTEGPIRRRRALGVEQSVARAGNQQHVSNCRRRSGSA